MKFILIFSLLICVIKIKCSNYCELQQQHCKTHKHIACSTNDFTEPSDWTEFELVTMTSTMRAEILEYFNEYRNRIALGKIPGFVKGANLAVLNWHWEFEYLMEESVMKAGHGKFYCVTMGNLF